MMSVGSKNILNFESTGNPGDIILNYGDPTVEHSELLKCDGGIYKRSDYPQIEKFFGYAGISPFTGIEVELATFKFSQGANLGYSRGLVAKDGDNVVVIVLTQRDNYGSVWFNAIVSHDDGATWSSIKKDYYSLCTQYAYSTYKVLYKDGMIYFVYRPIASSRGSDYLYILMLKDDGSGVQHQKITHKSNNSTSDTPYFFERNGYLYIWHYDGEKYHLIYRSITDSQGIGSGWAEIDVTSIDPRKCVYIKETNKLILGYLYSGTSAIVNDDNTLTTFTCNGFEINRGFDTSRIFYQNGEYTCIYPYSTNSGSWVYRSKDLINWTSEQMPLPTYGDGETSSYNYYFDTLGDASLFSDSNFITLQYRDSEHYFKLGKNASNGFGYIGGVRFDSETNEPYLLAASQITSSDTEITCKIKKCYLYEILKFFILPTMNQIYKITGVGSKEYPCIRAE